MHSLNTESIVSQADFFVSVSGNDNNKGTLDQPFATIERARVAVQKLKNAKLEGPIIVLIRGGTYYLDRPIVMGPEDSGTKEQPIIYAAYPGEIPIISGGVSITGGWAPYKDGIFVCDIDKDVNFTQLFVNGKRQIRARFPNYNASSGSYIYPMEANLPWPNTYFKYDPETFTKNNWKKPEEAILHIFPQSYWGNLQWEITKIDQENHTVHLGNGGFQINEIMQGATASTITKHSRYFIENVFEELDSPGEWYLDKEAGKLYYMPEEQTDMETVLVEAPILKNVIEVRGTQDQPVQHLSFSGLRITHTASTFLETYEAPSLGDWTIHRSGSVVLEGAVHCSITNCFFDAVGGNAIFLNNYNRYNRVYGNLITESGESAICLVGSKHLTIGSNKSFPSDNTIMNNKIHTIGVFGKQTAGVFISVSKDNIVSHNHIYNVPRAAICINDGTWGGHIIEYNDIHDTVQETSDHGPFNSWGRDRYWCLSQSHGGASHGAGNVKSDARKTVIIRNNRFRDQQSWGIDLDDGSSNYHVYNNLCIGLSIKLREGDHRSIENNIFVNCANPPGFHIGYENNHDKFVRNIVVANSEFDNPEVDIDFTKGESKGKVYDFIGPPLKGRWVKELDYNLFYSDIGEFKATVRFIKSGNEAKDYQLKDWQELGFDQHSVFADPLFVNPEQGDYRVLPESLALKLGFKNFAMDQFGLLPDYPEFYGPDK